VGNHKIPHNEEGGDLGVYLCVGPGSQPPCPSACQDNATPMPHAGSRRPTPLMRPLNIWASYILQSIRMYEYVVLCQVNNTTGHSLDLDYRGQK
jgi:hypothetical protein